MNTENHESIHDMIDVLWKTYDSNPSKFEEEKDKLLGKFEKMGVSQEIVQKNIFDNIEYGKKHASFGDRNWYIQMAQFVRKYEPED